jgi:hypothetical protein
VLIHPLQHKLGVIPGTRFLETDLGLSGAYVLDPLEPDRHWTVQWLLAPIPGRRLGGVRAKLADTRGFVTFINQRDLEVILGHGRPGDYCTWTGKNYPGPQDPDWYGLCCDEEDLLDDLHERECRLREQYTTQPWLPTGLEMTRRVHLGQHQDVEELFTLLWDMNPDTGQYPDATINNTYRRWARVEQTRLTWRRLP